MEIVSIFGTSKSFLKLSNPNPTPSATVVLRLSP
uniref:Uncharacterized protein n=1 Tax=Rhizophora mucronata TaxID=61149 RepID=A0A2P2NAN0_RHIMU